MNSFSSHLTRLHSRTDEHVMPTQGIEVQTDEVNAENSHRENTDEEMKLDIDNQQESIRKNILQLFVKLYAKLLVPSSTNDVIANEIENTCSLYRETILSRIRGSCLENKSVILEVIGNDLLKDVMNNVQSNHLRQKKNQNKFPTRKSK